MGVKGQSCPSFVEHWIFIMRVTSVRVPLNTLAMGNVHVFCDPAEDWNFCRVRNKLYGGNTRTYYISSSRREKRCFRVNMLSEASNQVIVKNVPKTGLS